MLTTNNILRHGYIKLPYLGEYCDYCAYEEFPNNHRLSLISHQPYYVILAENNTLCYVPQGMNICGQFYKSFVL